MLEVHNVKVYDLKESVISCRNAMRLEMPEYTDEEFEKGLERAKKLVQASKKSPNVKCHDNFLTGIRVSFDLKYTQYITKQFQRYHWFDYVSSSSLMHRLVKMDADSACNKYVSQNSVDELQKCIDQYNDIASMEHYPGDGNPLVFELRDGTVLSAETKGEALYYAYMKCISNCPMGVELFVRVSTNYKQLQTIYWQRKDHKLKEDWGEFCKFVENLPYAKEFITGDTEQ
jgi:hypothetical protein